MNVEIRGIVITGITLGEAADLRRQLAISDAEIEAEVMQREADAVAEADALDDQAKRDGAAIGAKEAARRLGVSTDYVRDHARELGGVKLTNSPKAPWRFDPAQIAERLCGAASEPSKDIGRHPVPTKRHRPQQARGGLLQVRGERP